jgi:hypothetical protein
MAVPPGAVSCPKRFYVPPTEIGSYKREGERLTICLPGGKGASPAGRARPAEFSGGEHMSLVVLERVKDE